MALSLQEAFSSLEDPRIERHKKHNLLDIIILTICSVISGAEGWEANVIKLRKILIKQKVMLINPP